MALEGVPKSDVCDYLLEPAQVEEKPQGKEQESDSEKSDGKAEARSKVTGKSSLVIFAIDISGSMSSTTTVPDLQGWFS